MIQDHKNTFHFPHGFLSILKIVKQQQKLTSTISALVSALQTIKAKSMVPMNLFHLLPSVEYLLLTKFEVCTLSYWPMLFHPHLWPKQCTQAKKQVEKGGSITYSTDQMFISSLHSDRGGRFTSNKLLNLAGHTVKYDLLNWPIIAHILIEKYNKNIETEHEINFFTSGLWVDSKSDLYSLSYFSW